MSPAALYALVAVGCVAAGALVWHVWFPIEIRRILGAKPPQWPKRNVGGGYDWPDGRITREPWRDDYKPDEVPPKLGLLAKMRNRWRRDIAKLENASESDWMDRQI